MSAAQTCPDASPHVSPGDSSQSSGAIVPTAGHTDFDGETEASDNTEAAVQRTAKGGSLLSTGKQRGSTTRAVETPRASLSSPEMSAEHLIEAVRVEGSGEGTADYSPLLPEQLVDPAMVAEVVEHVRELLMKERSESGGGDGSGRNGEGAEDARTAAAEGNGEDGDGEGKDTASSSGEGISPFELRVAILGGESAGTADDSCPSIGPRDTPGVTGPSIGPDTPGPNEVLDILLSEVVKKYFPPGICCEIDVAVGTIGSILDHDLILLHFDIDPTSRERINTVVV